MLSMDSSERQDKKKRINKAKWAGVCNDYLHPAIRERWRQNQQIISTPFVGSQQLLARCNKGLGILYSQSITILLYWNDIFLHYLEFPSGRINHFRFTPNRTAGTNFPTLQITRRDRDKIWRHRCPLLKVVHRWNTIRSFFHRCL